MRELKKGEREKKKGGYDRRESSSLTDERSDRPPTSRAVNEGGRKGRKKKKNQSAHYNLVPLCEGRKKKGRSRAYRDVMNANPMGGKKEGEKAKRGRGGRNARQWRALVPR